MGGAYGLDYGVVREVARLIGIGRKALPDAFADLRTLEHEALAIMRDLQE